MTSFHRKWTRQKTQLINEITRGANVDVMYFAMRGLFLRGRLQQRQDSIMTFWLGRMMRDVIYKDC